MQEPSDAFRKSAAELPYCCRASALPRIPNHNLSPHLLMIPLSACSGKPVSTDNQTACLEERRYPCFFWDEHLAEFPVGKDYSAVMVGIGRAGGGWFCDGSALRAPLTSPSPAATRRRA